MSKKKDIEPVQKLPNKRSGEKVIARFSAEQTARFLAGGEIGRPQYTDPAMQAKMDRNREHLCRALRQSVLLFQEALAPESEQSSKRLGELWAGAEAGNENATRLFLAMYGELLLQAVRTDG